MWCHMIEFNTIACSEIPEDHPVRVFSRCWFKETNGGKPFLWSAFNPMKSPTILPWILVIDCLSNDEYRYRLCGTGCEQLLGVNVTGKKFGTYVDPEWARSQLPTFEAIISGQGPIFSNGVVPVVDREHIKVFRGLFAFSSTGETTDRMVAVLAPDSAQIS